jgi:hypothetical protein
MNRHLSRVVPCLCLLLMPLTATRARAAERGFDKPGAYVFTVPPGVFSLTLTVWGAGGAGGRGGASGGQGGGGGSGAVTRCFLSTLPGQKYRLRVGEGGRLGARRLGGSSSVGVLVAGSVRTLVEAAGGAWGQGADQGGTGGAGGEAPGCLASAQPLQSLSGSSGGPGGAGPVSGGEGGQPPVIPQFGRELPVGTGSGGQGGAAVEAPPGAARAKPRPGGAGGAGYVLVEW